MNPMEIIHFVFCWLGAVIAFAGEILIGFSLTREFVLIESRGVSIGLGILILVGGFMIYHASYTMLKRCAV